MKTHPLLQKLSGLNSIESELGIKKLLFLGRLIKEPKLSNAVKSLFDSRTKSFFDSDITSLGILPSIAEALHKYELFDYFEIWNASSTFPTYTSQNTDGAICFICKEEIESVTHFLLFQKQFLLSLE